VLRELVMGNKRSTVVLCGVGMLAGLLARSSTAEAAARPVGVYIEGRDAREVSDAMVSAAPASVKVVDAGSLFHGRPGGARALFDRNHGKARDAELRRIRELAATLGVDALLLGRERRDGAKRHVLLLVVDRTAGEKELQEVIYEPGHDGADSDLVARAHEALDPYADVPDAVAASSGHGEPSPPKQRDTPVQAAPVNAAEPKEGTRDSTPIERGVFNRSLFQVEVGVDAVGRRFDYHDGLSNNLRSYDVAPAFMLDAGAEIFPLGAFDVLRDLGLTGSYARSLFLESGIAGGSNLSTVESAYSVGLRFRIHPWGDGGTLIGVADEYAVQSFVFDSAGAAIDGQIPSVDYQANRTSVDAHIPLGRFALVAGAGFRAVLSAGDVASRFRGSSAEGVDGKLGVSATVVSGWEVRLLLDYERYFYSFHPVPGDGYVAGGALDQLFGGRLSVAYVF
jgi:hypothetical protein